MAQNISLKKSSQSMFSKAVKNIKTLMKKNELNNSGQSNGNTANGKVNRAILGRRKRPKQKIYRPSPKWNQHGKGIVFLSHIPEGFYEEQMLSYFNQFGRVTRLNLVRSEKTGNPKGYAYIEFLYSEVAQVVAETMNNYLMSGRLLKAEYIPGERASKKMFKNSYIRPDNCPRVKSQQKWILKTNRKLTPTEETEAALKETKHVNRLKKQLEKCGIQLDFQLENSSLAFVENSPANPILEIDESDDEVEFKLHPNVTKILKRKSSALTVSPSGRKVKVEMVKSPGYKSGVDLEKNEDQNISPSKKESKRNRKRSHSTGSSPASTPEKRRLTLLQGLKSKKSKNESRNSNTSFKENQESNSPPKKTKPSRIPVKRTSFTKTKSC